MVATVNTKELREKANALHEKALAHLDKHRNEDGTVPREELEAAQQMTRDSQNLIEQAEMLETGSNVSVEEELNNGRFNLNGGDLARNEINDYFNRPIEVRMGANNATVEWDVKNPNAHVSQWGEDDPNATPVHDESVWSADYHRDFMSYITRLNPTASQRPASLVERSGSSANGSFTSICAPIRFAANVLTYCREMLWIRQLATVLTVREACNLGIIKEVQTGSSAAWGGACKEPENCELPGFALKTLSPQWMSYCAKICRLILNQRCEIDVESFIARKLARDSAELEEDAFMNGDGKEKPLGIFYNPTSGTDFCGAEARFDYSAVCNNTCGIDWTFFVKAYMNLPECSRNNPASLSWMFHKNIICQLMLLCDGNGRPLWMNSLQAGQPSLFLNHPVRESARAPSTIESGKFFGAIADWSGYYIADGLDQTVERDDNIRTNEACWVGRRSVDGMIVEPEKFVRLKCD